MESEVKQLPSRFDGRWARVFEYVRRAWLVSSGAQKPSGTYMGEIISKDSSFRAR